MALRWEDLTPEGIRERFAHDRIQLVDGLRALAAERGAADLRLLSWIARLDRAEVGREDACRSTGEWVARELGVSKWKADRMVASAHALSSLPLICAALEKGTLSLDKVLELTRIATPDSEKKLLKWARRVTPVGIRRRADAERALRLNKEQSAHDTRGFEWWTDRDGRLLHLSGSLPVAEGAVLTAALDRIADRLEDERPKGQRGALSERRADALVELASLAIVNDKDPDRATVMVHSPVDVLARSLGTATLAGGTSIHPETARRLTCDCRLQSVLEGKYNDPIGIGRASENVPRWLRRQMLHRDDHTCQFPGCGGNRRLHAHHIWHWGRGGPTELHNLTSLCSFHHWLVHEGGWSVSRSSSRELTWFTQGGRVYDPGAPPPTELEVARSTRTIRNDRNHRLAIEARSYSALFRLPLGSAQ